MSSDRAKLRAAISRAIGYLAEHQLDHGEFRTFVATDLAMRRDCVFDSSPFTTAVVLYSLLYVPDDPRTPEMRNKAIRFLLDEMEMPGVWSYWASRSGKRIPPDVDDTSLVSFVLQAHIGSPARHNEPVLAALRQLCQANQRELLANRDEQGRFRTWLNSPERNDVDSVVNANAVLYLGSTPEVRPVCDFLAATLLEGLEVGSYWYYLNHWALYYAVSRAFHHGASLLSRTKPVIRQKVLAAQRPDGSFGSPLSTALAVCALLNVESGDSASVWAAVDHLLLQQQEEGAWAMLPFYCGPPPPQPVSRWFGSEELTTAVCLEALARAAVLP